MPTLELANICTYFYCYDFLFKDGFELVSCVYCFVCGVRYFCWCSLTWQLSQDGSQYWWSKAKREQTEWRVDFGRALALSSLQLTWHKASVPHNVTVYLSADRGATWEPIGAPLPVPSRDSADMYVALPVATMATTCQACTGVKLVQRGFAKINEESSGRCHKLERCRFFEPLATLPHEAPRDLIQRLVTWLARVAVTSSSSAARTSAVPPLILPPGGFATPSAESAWLEARLAELSKAAAASTASPVESSGEPGSKIMVEAGSAGDLALAAFQRLVLCTGSLGHTLQLVDLLLSAELSPGQSDSAKSSSIASDKKGYGSHALTAAAETLKWIEEKASKTLACADNASARAATVGGAYDRLQFQVHGGSNKALELTKGGRGLRATALRSNSKDSSTAYLPLQLPNDGSTAQSWSLTLSGDAVDGLWLGVGRLGAVGGPGPDLDAVQPDADTNNNTSTTGNSDEKKNSTERDVEESEWSVRWLVEAKTGKVREDGREGENSSMMNFHQETVPKAGPGDVVSFELDLKAGTLSYRVNSGAAATFVYVGGGVVPVVEVAPCSPSRATLAASSSEGGLVREVILNRLDVNFTPSSASTPANEPQQTAAGVVTYLAGLPCTEQGSIRGWFRHLVAAGEKRDDTEGSLISSSNQDKGDFDATNLVSARGSARMDTHLGRQASVSDEQHVQDETSVSSTEPTAAVPSSHGPSCEGSPSSAAPIRTFEKVVVENDEIIGRFGEAPKVRRPERKASDTKLTEFIVAPVTSAGVFFPHSITMCPYSEEQWYRTGANGRGFYAVWPLSQHGVDRFESNVSTDVVSSLGPHRAWLTFSVLGDGVELWSSKRLLVGERTSDYASVSLRGCTELELRVHVEVSDSFEKDVSQGKIQSNQMSTFMFAAAMRAVWEQPVLICDADANDPIAPLLCGDKSPAVSPSAFPTPQAPLKNTEQHAPTSLEEVGQRILEAVGKLASDSKPQRKSGCLASCVETTAPVMNRLERLLSALVRWQLSTNRSAAEPAVERNNNLDGTSVLAENENACRLQVFTGTEAERDAALLATLRLCRANLSRLPENVALEDHSAWLPPMRTAIETLMASDTGACGGKVQAELSSLVEESLPLLYPNPSDVARLLLDLMRRCQARSQLPPAPEVQEVVSNATSTSTGLKGVRVALLEQLLKRLSSSGEEVLLAQVLAHQDPISTTTEIDEATTPPIGSKEMLQGSGAGSIQLESTVLGVLMDSSAIWHDALAYLSMPMADGGTNSVSPKSLADASEAPLLERLANAARGVLAKAMHLSLTADDGLESWGDDGEDGDHSSIRSANGTAPVSFASNPPLGGGVEESKTEDSAQEEKTSSGDVSTPLLPPQVDSSSLPQDDGAAPLPPVSVLTPARFGALLLRHCERQLAKARATATGSSSRGGQPAPALARALVQKSACGTLLPAFTAAALGRAGLPSPLAAALLPPMVALGGAADHLSRALEDLADEEHGGDDSGEDDDDEAEEDKKEEKSSGWLVESGPSSSGTAAWELAYSDAHASKMRSAWAQDLKWGGHSGLGGGCLGASLSGAIDSDDQGAPTAPLLFNGSLHGAHVVIGDGRRTVTNRHRNAFSNAICDLPGLTPASSSRRGRSEPRGISTGRHELSWRVLTSAPSDDCGLGVGLLAVGAPALGASTNRPQPVTVESPAFAADTYLVRAHCAWMFECSGTRFHDPEAEAGGAAVEYGRPWRVGDVVTVIVDLDASSPPPTNSSPESAGTGHGRGTVRNLLLFLLFCLHRFHIVFIIICCAFFFFVKAMITAIEYFARCKCLTLVCCAWFIKTDAPLGERRRPRARICGFARAWRVGPCGVALWAPRLSRSSALPRPVRSN